MSLAGDNASLCGDPLVGQGEGPRITVKDCVDNWDKAKAEDWRLEIAGQRVQIIKKDAKGHGKLEFGTEIVAAKDGSLAALLGASPGASTAVQAMIDVIERCFKDRIASPEWQGRMKTLVPSYGQSLVKDADLLKQVRQRTLSTLKLV